MFTGIISDIGVVVVREAGRFTIRTRYPASSLDAVEGAKTVLSLMMQQAGTH